MPPLEQHIAAALQQQQELGLLRAPPKIEYLQGMHCKINGRKVLSFCSNDFLGFAQDPEPTHESQRTGSGASRLVSGNHTQIRQLEKSFAEKLGYEDAILLASGYQANIAGLAQIPLPEGSKLYSDALNHASIIDALRIGTRDKQILPHLQSPPTGPNWWVLESRYSMDGDAPEPGPLNDHLQKGGYLYLDEAHRFGLEANGHGLAQQLNTKPQIANYPLGKAFGLHGAFLAGNTSCIQWIRQFSRAYIYTTAAGPRFCSMIEHRMLKFFGEEGNNRRNQLQKNIKLAAQLLNLTLRGPILSIQLGSNERALQASEDLLEAGFHVQAIRPPTVPKGTARLRITLSALHSADDIQALAREIRKLAP